jgi:hypothetical protein
LRIYIDTSVIGGCSDEEFAEWSLRLMQEFRDGLKVAVISDITLQELELAPEIVKSQLKELPPAYKEYIILDNEAIKLAQAYLREGVITDKFLLDAQHIAMATLSRVDVMVSWNFKHIVNLNRIRLYNSVNLKLGYPMIDIRSPREVLYEEL